MAKIKTLKDKGVVFYPQTHIEAVVDDSGNTITELIDNISKEIAPLETEVEGLGNRVAEESERAVAKETELAGEIQRVENIAGSKQDQLISGTTIKTINGQPVLGSGNINITAEASTTIIEPNVKFANGNEGNTDIANGVTPIDAATYPFFSANRLNFMNVNTSLEIEFSRDSGETWYPYPHDLNDVSNSIPNEYELVGASKKTIFVSDINPKGEAFYLGARKTTQEASDWLRITVTSSAVLYFRLRKILLQVCTGGLSNMQCKIDVLMNGSTEFVEVKKDIELNGWTNWNSIALSNAFGGAETQTNQYKKIRITIFGKSISSTNIGKTDIRVNGLRMLGETMWSGNNTLQQTGHLYEIGVDKKATFPAAVVAPSFEGIATSVVDGAISTAKLGNSAVITSKIRDNAVTEAKLSTEVQAKINDNPLRALYIAAGAKYNDSGVDKTETSPWGETVTHKAGHYYLNGLGDITEDDMARIYNLKEVIYRLDCNRVLQSVKNIRTIFPSAMNGIVDALSSRKLKGTYSFHNTDLEELIFQPASQIENHIARLLPVDTPSLQGTFASNSKLKRIGGIDCSNVKFNQTFDGCTSLVEVRLYKVSNSVSFGDSANISENSILYIIQNAAPTSAITITLHHDAYARLTSDTEVVTTLSEKNASLAGTNGKISLVCATHSEEVTPNA